MEGLTMDMELERKKPSLRPLILVERARTHSERERGFPSSPSSSNASSSSDSVKSGTSPTNIEGTFLSSFLRQRSTNLGSCSTTVVSLTLPTSPGTSLAEREAPHKQKEEEDTQPHRPLPRQYHLPFRPIRNLEIPAALDRPESAIVAHHVSGSQADSPSRTTESGSHLEEDCQPEPYSVLDSRRNPADRQTQRTESDVPPTLDVAAKKENYDRPTRTPLSLSLPLTPLASRSRSGSDSSSQSSASSHTSDDSVSSTESTWPTHPHSLRRSINFSGDGLPFESRASYNTFGGEPSSPHAVGRSFMEVDSEKEEGEEGEDSAANVPPTVSQTTPTSIGPQFLTSDSPISPPSPSSPSSSSSVYPVPPPSETSELSSSPLSFVEGEVLTATRIRIIDPLPAEFALPHRDKTSVPESYVFPGSQHTHRAPPPLPAQGTISPGRPIFAPSPQHAVPRPRVSSSPASITNSSPERLGGPFPMSTSEVALDRLPTCRPSLLRVVALPSGPFVKQADPPRLSFKLTPVRTPSPQQPSSVCAPFSLERDQSCETISEGTFFHRDSESTFGTQSTGTSSGGTGNKASKLKRMAGLVTRLFERRGSTPGTI